MIWFSCLAFIIICILLVLLAYTDHKSYILPNRYNALLALFFVILHGAAYFAFISPIDMILGCVLAGGLLLIIRHIANKATGADALGLGDVKLMMAAGLGLGIPDIFLALSLGSVFGMIHGVILREMAIKKNPKKAPKLSQINVPAGVGLCIGIFCVMLYRYHALFLMIGAE